MIVVDTSALLAIVLGETLGQACFEAITASQGLLISAGTLAEAFIVASGKGKTAQLVSLLDALVIEVVPVTKERAREIGTVYARWGRGHHLARLNFGDCFAYALARERDCPLLYIGNDFARTDIASALD